MGFSFDPGEPSKTKTLKKLSSYLKKTKKQVAQRATIAHLSPMCQG